MTRFEAFAYGMLDSNIKSSGWGAHFNHILKIILLRDLRLYLGLGLQHTAISYMSQDDQVACSSVGRLQDQVGPRFFPLVA